MNKPAIFPANAKVTPGRLYLLPVTLGDDRPEAVLSAEVIRLAQTLDTFVVENEKTARRFLSAIKTEKPVRELSMLLLNEHTTDQELPALLAPLLAGKDVAVMSEAGCPGIADPGARLVALAHQRQVQVLPLVGPSSILLALMGSGFNGQRFTFLGYLPSDKTQRIKRIQEIEKTSRQQRETQIFIETPYRNQHLLEDLVAHCQASTSLCIACNLTLPEQIILSRPIRAWKNTPLPELHKQPTVFLLLA